MRMLRATLACVLLASAARLCAAPPAHEALTQPAEAPADAAIREKIARCRKAAEGLRLDGIDRDWAGIPQQTDPKGDADGDPSRDIVAAAVAPTDKYLWILIRTAGTPSIEPWSFYAYVDLFGDQSRQIRIELPEVGKPPEANVPDEAKTYGKAKRLPRSAWVARKVVEIRIDYRDIEALLPKEQAALVADAAARPWVRIGCESWNGKKKKLIDRGPLVGSYRLIDQEYPLDTPLKEPLRSAVAIEMPLCGRWYVSQGPFGSVSHEKMWAYDLVRLDAHGRTSLPPRSEKLEDYYAYKEEIVSPVDGLVRVAADRVQDSPPLRPLDRDAVVNEIYLGADDGFGVALVHLAPKSLKVKVGDAVTAGQPLALVGNSGVSDAPHLHLSLWGGMFRRTPTPVLLRNVRVGLNPSDDDPWTRELKQWSPRQGYFVSRIED